MNNTARVSTQGSVCQFIQAAGPAASYRSFMSKVLRPHYKTGTMSVAAIPICLR